MRPIRLLAFFVILALASILIGPLVLPIPPLPDPPELETLLDPDSRFIEINDIGVHYKMSGQGEPAILLLHGFGAHTFSWREVMQPLSEGGTVVAFDRPAFGFTERPMPGEWSGLNPYSQDGQIALTIGLMDQLNLERAIVVGNSAGGTLAMAMALEHPQRVEALVLVAPAIYTVGGAPAWVRPFLGLPHFERLGPWFARSIAGEQGEMFLEAAWYDPSKITDDIWAGYRKPLQTENWDRALWEVTLANRENTLPARLPEVTVPVLVLTGDPDHIVPTEESVRLAGELPGAQLAVISACGHLPQEECPQAFLDAVLPFIQSVTGK